jgi:glycosyltransferase involved in cell wall biosynthesis
MPKNFLKLFLLPLGGESWTGGITYTRNLIYALNKYRQDIKIYMFDGENNGLFSNFDNVSFIKKNDKKNIRKDLIDKTARHFFSYDYKTSTILRSDSENNPDVVFSTRWKLGRNIATLYWIPDFQVLNLPEMYSEKQIQSLKGNFKKGINNCKLIVLSSNDAKKDLKSFEPQAVAKARVVHFVAHLPDNIYESTPSRVVNRYNIPEKFFYLPNQFWKHKNHKLVLESLKILKDKGVYPIVVMSGNPIDSRNPNYFAEILRQISMADLRGQAIILGLVDHEDVYMLMRQSVGVINPSLFEGWSTTVEEAKSLGKKLILSDLPVHREQDPPCARFFAPDDPFALAKLLEEEWSNSSSGPDQKLEENAKRETPVRMKEFADSFAEIVCEAAGNG